MAPTGIQRGRTSIWFSCAIFTIVGPGLVLWYLPWRLLVRIFPRTTMPPVAWRLAGAVLLAAGTALYLVCAWEFATAGHGTPAPYDPPRRLVTYGPYRFVRNPIFVALLLVVLGEALWSGRHVLYYYAAFLVTYLYLRVVLIEEPGLRAHFGREYEEYRARVPRWLPWPRPHSR